MLLFLLSLGKWIKDRERKVAVKQFKPVNVKSKEIKKSSPPYGKEVFKAAISESCPQFKNIEKNQIKNKEILAKNLHYKRDGEIFRLRVFIEDGDNGGFEKLVHYKEDADGFARIQKLPEGKEVNPSNTYLKSFYKDEEVIHEEQDYRLELNDGRELTISEINGEIVKLNSQQDDCLYEK